jgi:TATA-binding protein-associated factor Taf7
MKHFKFYITVETLCCSQSQFSVEEEEFDEQEMFGDDDEYFDEDEEYDEDEQDDKTSANNARVKFQKGGDEENEDDEEYDDEDDEDYDEDDEDDRAKRGLAGSIKTKKATTKQEKQAEAALRDALAEYDEEEIGDLEDDPDARGMIFLGFQFQNLIGSLYFCSD